MMAMYQQFDTALHAHKPLVLPNKLGNPDFPFAISFIYGDEDWMDSRGSREIVRANRFYTSGESQIYLLNGANHNLWYNAPDSFVDVLTNDLLGIYKHNFQIKKYTTNYVDRNGKPVHTDTEYHEIIDKADQKLKLHSEKYTDMPL